MCRRCEGERGCRTEDHLGGAFFSPRDASIFNCNASIFRLRAPAYMLGVQTFRSAHAHAQTLHHVLGPIYDSCSYPVSPSSHHMLTTTD